MEETVGADALVCCKAQERQGSAFLGRFQYVQAIIIMLAALSGVNAQIGTTICVCSPSSYNMTFNFSQTCDDSVVEGDGIITTDCAVAPFQNDNVTDLLPVSVGSIDILELDETLESLSQSSRFGTFQDGASFAYNSVSNDPSRLNETAFPKALQISVIGNNADGESLFYAGLIVFATDCIAFPTIEEDSRIGWITFVSNESKTLCQLSLDLVGTIAHTLPSSFEIFLE